jgi:hypothetical protein
MKDWMVEGGGFDDPHEGRNALRRSPGQRGRRRFSGALCQRQAELVRCGSVESPLDCAVLSEANNSVGKKESSASNFSLDKPSRVGATFERVGKWNFR